LIDADGDDDSGNDGGDGCGNLLEVRVRRHIALPLTVLPVCLTPIRPTPLYACQLAYLLLLLVLALVAMLVLNDI